MNRRQKIIVSVTGIFLVLLLLVGLTYAYFLTRIDGNEETKSISVTTANLALVYGDGNGIIEPDEPIMPGTTIDSKTFTVTNEGNATTDYVVVIEDVSVTYAETVNEQVAGEVATFESNDFVYTLTCTSDGEACDGIDTEATFPITGGILVGNSIEVGKTHSYTLTVTYKETGEDQSNDMNKTLTAKVNIKNITEVNPYSDDTSSLAYNIINNAIALTNEEKDAGYAKLLATPKTKVAQEISAEDESVLSITQDEYGTSYYYRGNVENNYLTFNNMCWRIVRIEGDGAIKILLADKESGCSTATLTKIDTAIIGYTAYNSKGTADYENGEMHAAFNTFLNGGNFISDNPITGNETTETYTEWDSLAKNKLKSTRICLGDITTTYDETGNVFYNDIINGLWKDELYYNSYVRLVGVGQTATATLKCKGNKTNEIQIFPLSADEVVFAGGKALSTNETYYINDGSKDMWWWTISMAKATSGYVNPFYAKEALNELNSADATLGLRPAVSLVSGTQIASGDGSIENPYIVE